MTASNTCDGCSLVVMPDEPLLDSWLILYIPKEPEPEPMAGFMDVAQIMAMVQGGGKSKTQYIRQEFCSWKCVMTKAMTVVFSQGQEEESRL